MAAKPKPYAAFGQLVTEGIQRSAGNKSLSAAQKELAKQPGYSVSTIYKWRRGERLPPPQTIEVLARLFIQNWSADRNWITRFLKEGLSGYPWPLEAIINVLFANGSKEPSYYSCFISYSSQNEAFVEQLYYDLSQAGVRCWFAPEDMKIGDKIRPAIDQSIQAHTSCCSSFLRVVQF